MGQTAQATATERFSDGRTQSVTTGFQSDAPPVATVTGGGLVTGVANGGATIFVRADGLQGHQLIRVVPDYHGTWEGGLRVTRCTQSGAWAAEKVCDEFPANFVSEYGLSLDQSGTAVVAIAGYEQDFPSVSAQVADDGRLSFASTLTATISEFTFSLEAQFAIDSQKVGELTGTVNEIWRAPNIAGEMRLAQTIVNARRTSPSPSSAPGARGAIKWRALSRLPR